MRLKKRKERTTNPSASSYIMITMFFMSILYAHGCVYMHTNLTDDANRKKKKKEKNKVIKRRLRDILIHDCENIIPSLTEEGDIVR